MQLDLLFYDCGKNTKHEIYPLNTFYVHNPVLLTDYRYNDVQ